MYLDSKEVVVILNILAGSRNKIVSLLPPTYSRLFNRTEVPIVKTIRNKNKDISLVFVERTVALQYLKDKYNFIQNKDINKELQDART